MPVPLSGVPRRAVSWILLAIAVLFVVVAAIRAFHHNAWPIVALPACLALVVGGVAWLILIARVERGTAPASRKLAGPGR